MVRDSHTEGWYKAVSQESFCHDVLEVPHRMGRTGCLGEFSTDHKEPEKFCSVWEQHQSFVPMPPEQKEGLSQFPGKTMDQLGSPKRPLPALVSFEFCLSRVARFSTHTSLLSARIMGGRKAWHHWCWGISRAPSPTYRLRLPLLPTELTPRLPPLPTWTCVGGAWSFN